MSEIITVHIGGSGTRVGLAFWEQITQVKEANQSTQNYKQSDYYYQRFYTQTLQRTHIPRAIFFDTDLRSKQQVRKSHVNFDPQNSIAKTSSCCGLFSQGIYSEGAQLIQQFIQKVRKQAQKCDILSGFILTQSPAGGAGSGMGSNALSKLREFYCDRIVEDMKILPGPDVKFQLKHLTPLQIYNIVLSTHYAIENTDIIHCYENNAAFSLLSREGSTHTSYDDINKYFGHCLNQHIHAYLQPGMLNTNQRKRATNLVLFPRIKHLCGSLSDKGAKNYLESALSPRNKMMIFPAPNDQRIFSSAIHVRDNWASQNQINKIAQEWSSRTKNTFVDWLPRNFHLSLGKKDPRQGQKAWILLNGSNNIQWIKKLCQMFTAQYRRKAFVSHYRALGMDEMEFTQAESNCNDLISEYIPYDTFVPEDEEFYNQQQYT